MGSQVQVQMPMPMQLGSGAGLGSCASLSSDTTSPPPFSSTANLITAAEYEQRRRGRGLGAGHDDLETGETGRGSAAAPVVPTIQAMPAMPAIPAIPAAAHPPASAGPALSPAFSPAPMGMAGFSSMVLMVSAHYAGLIHDTTYVCPIALFAGTLLLGSSLRLRDTLLATNFGVFGAFWLSVGLFLLFGDATQTQDADAAITYLRVALLIFCLFGLTAALFHSRAVAAIFLTLVLKLACFIAGHLAGCTPVLRLGGWIGMVSASAGFYTFGALYLRPLLHLPLGPPLLLPRSVAKVTAVMPHRAT